LERKPYSWREGGRKGVRKRTEDRENKGGREAKYC